MHDPYFITEAYNTDHETLYHWDWWDEENMISDPLEGSAGQFRRLALDKSDGTSNATVLLPGGFVRGWPRPAMENEDEGVGGVDLVAE